MLKSARSVQRDGPAVPLKTPLCRTSGGQGGAAVTLDYVRAWPSDECTLNQVSEKWKDDRYSVK